MDAQAIGTATEQQAGLRGANRLAALSPAWPIAAAAAVALLIQGLWIPVDADVSWLITVCERVLGGDRLYVDIIELNPPASVWLYLPLVGLAALVGLKAEAVVIAAFVAAAVACVIATLRLAARLGDAPPPALLAAVLSFVTLVMPMANFAQREHAALLLAFPVLAALAVIAEGRPLSRPAVIASGLAAGMIVIIKPYFLPAILIPALWAAYRRRSVSPLLPGLVAAATAILLYAAAILVFARAYLDWVPVIAATYGAMRVAAWKAVIGPTFYPAICVALAFVLRPRKIPSLSIAWLLGAAGFLLATFAQGKVYPNHWLPQAGLALAAAFAIVSVNSAAPLRKAAVAAGLAMVALLEMQFWAITPDPAIASEIRRLGPAQPRIIALSPQLTTGHPVTRNVGGKWAGSRAGLYTASGARAAGLDSGLAQRAYREDIESFANDMRRTRPDIILVHPASKDWLLREPAIAQAMQPYEFATLAGDTEIWLPRNRSR